MRSLKATAVNRRQNRIVTEPSFREILDFALALSREAGQFILPLWKNVTVHRKPDGSEVTEADRGAEQLLRRRIAERFPDHAILGEEFGGERERNAEHLWLIDPVDGTRGIMYDKRPAWFLAGLAPQKGGLTRLSDIEIAVMVELPTTKQWRADRLVPVVPVGGLPG